MFGAQFNERRIEHDRTRSQQGQVDLDGPDVPCRS
jgi:hypothetical protein